jgi:iron complex outermembrane receptor protein
MNQGNRVARMPEHTASIWLSYDMGRVGVEGLTVGAGARYVGDRFSDAANTAAYEINDLLVFDASLSYAWDNWQATLAARNLSDKQDVTYCQGGTPQVLGLLSMNPAFNPAEAGGCAYGAGRSIELTLTRRF